MYIYRLVSVLIIGAYLLSPAIIDNWINPETDWYRPYILWALLIILAAWLERQGRNDEF
jgi:hypothetical protein